MTKSKTERNKFILRKHWWFFLWPIFLISIFFYGRHNYKQEQAELDTRSMKTTGVITKVYKMKSRGNWFNYEFEISGLKYKGSNQVSNSYYKGITEGMSVDIRFEYDNPEIHEPIDEDTHF